MSRPFASHTLLLTLLASASCSTAGPPPVVNKPPTTEEGHPHELVLPPVGPGVRVTLDGKSVDVPLAGVPHDGTTLPFAKLWKAAFPLEDPAALHFDFTGSDGFHPAARPPCARLLGSTEVNGARIDVVTHDLSYDGSVQLPGCYRVKAVVSIAATR